MTERPRLDRSRNARCARCGGCRVIKLDMHAVAKLTEAMQVIVDGSAKPIEKLVSLHRLNNVVEALDLGFANRFQIVVRNVGNAFLRVVLCTVNDLIECSFNDRTCLNDYKLVERIVLVRCTQPTKRIPIHKNVVSNFKIADEVAPNYFDFPCHAVTSEGFNDGTTPR